MVYKTQHATKLNAKPQTVPRIYQLQSPEITRTLAELHAKYGKYALPDAELRELIDKAMGKKTLTEELYAMREGR
jgi:hypothetical protein